MKKQYTKKQITEAIKHWKGVLRKMNESSSYQSAFEEYYSSSDWNDEDTFNDMLGVWDTKLDSEDDAGAYETAKKSGLNPSTLAGDVYQMLKNARALRPNAKGVYINFDGYTAILPIENYDELNRIADRLSNLDGYLT